MIFEQRPLTLQAYPRESDVYFGWKTAREVRNDDATWATGEGPYPLDWQELLLSPEGLSLDLAFAIYGAEVPPLCYE